MTPPDSDLDALWRAIQERLRASVPESTFSLWLRAAARSLGADGDDPLPHRPGGHPRLGRAPLLGADRAKRCAAPARALEQVSFAAPRRGRRRRRADVELNPNYTFERFVIGAGQPPRPRRRAGRRRGALGGLQPALPPRPARARQDPPAGRDRQLPARPTRPASASATRPPSRFTNEFVAALRSAAAARRFKARYRDLDVLLVDDVQFLEGKHAHRGGVLPHLQRPLRGRQPARPLRRPHPERALDPRLAPARPLRVGPDGRGRAAQPRHPPHRPAPPGRARPASRSPTRDALAELAGRIDANVRQLHGALTRVIAHASLTARPLSSELIAEVDPRRPPRPRSRPRSRRSSSGSPSASASPAPSWSAPSRAATPLRARQVAIFLTRELDRPLAAPDRPPLRRPRPLHRPQLAAPRRSRPRRGPGARRAESTSCARAIHNPRRQARLTADGAVRIHAFPQRLPQAANRISSAESLPSPDFSTSPNPTQEGIHHLKLTTKREELVSKLSIVSRAVSTRAATQALSGILLDAAEDGRVTLARHRPRDGPADRRSRPSVEGDGLGPAARPPARRGRPLARRPDGGDRAARGRARRRDPQRRLQLPPAGPARPRTSRSFPSRGRASR